MLNKTEQAHNVIDEALAIDPLFRFALHTKYIRLEDGDLEAALTIVEEARKKYPDQPGYLQMLFELNWRSNNREKALRYFIELLDLHQDSIQSTVIAHLYFTMDEPENAYRWIQKAIDNRESLVTYTATDLLHQEYQSEPRFQELFKKINHPLYVD
jgi:tetratricopeptide (TPR) repeat protein